MMASWVRGEEDEPRAEFGRGLKVKSAGGHTGGGGGRQGCRPSWEGIDTRTVQESVPPSILVRYTESDKRTSSQLAFLVVNALREEVGGSES